MKMLKGSTLTWGGLPGISDLFSVFLLLHHNSLLWIKGSWRGVQTDAPHNVQRLSVVEPLPTTVIMTRANDVCAHWRHQRLNCMPTCLFCVCLSTPSWPQTIAWLELSLTSTGSHSTSKAAQAHQTIQRYFHWLSILKTVSLRRSCHKEDPFAN